MVGTCVPTLGHMSQLGNGGGRFAGVTATRPVIEANRRGKREQIIDAAKQVLARDGLAACTARSVAEASPLSKSAVHYYFDDIHQIVDLAMREHVTAMVTGLRHAADGVPDPAEKLW